MQKPEMPLVAQGLGGWPSHISEQGAALGTFGELTTQYESVVATTKGSSLSGLRT